ncbi:C25 family cysteine peptidase [Calditrichota bacterium]
MKVTIFPLLLILIAVSFSFAAFDDDTPTTLPEVFSWERDGSNAVVRYQSPGLLWKQQDDGTELPLLAGSGEAFVPGAPRLPVYSILVYVPDGMDAVISSVKVRWEDAGVHRIVHDPGSMPELPEELAKWEAAELDSKVYTEISNQSRETAIIGQTGRWRDIRVAPLTIRALRYDAVTGQTDLAAEVEVELRFVPAEKPDQYNPPGISEAMYSLYNNYVLGAQDELDEESVRRGTYLIICRPGAVNNIGNLVSWRTKCGYNVIVATTDQTGTSANSIHDFIDDVYEDGDISLEYVCLLGDTDDTFAIPTYFFPGNLGYNPQLPTDHKYTIDLQLNQGIIANVLPRYLVGRLSVDTNSEIAVVINKILQYEATPDNGDLDRFGRALMIAKNAPGITQRLTKEWVRRTMLNNGYDEVEEQYYPGNASVNGINNEINEGVAWVNYRGYGHYYGWWIVGGDYTSPSVQLLTNNNKLPVVTSMVCGTGNFDRGEYDPNFGETWLRYGTPNSLKGAVAFIGPGELDTHTRWNNIIDGEWYRGMFDLGNQTLGQCFLGARIGMAYAYPYHWNANPGNGGALNSVWFYWHNYNILGDPALAIRNEIPVEIVADYLEDLPENTTFLRVEAWLDDDDETLLEGGRVVITNDDNEILGADFTDEDGIAYVYFDQPPAGENLAVTITHPEMIPFLGDLTISDVSGLEIFEIDFTEDEIDEENNGDGIINPGELIIPGVVFQVVEPDGISGLNLTVSLPGGGGEVMDDYEDLGDVNFEAEVAFEEIRIRIDSEWQNEIPLEVLFSFEGDDDFTQSHLVVFEGITAPVLAINEIDHGQSLSPGDDVTLSITLANLHPDLDAGEINATLRTTSHDVTITDAEGAWNDLPADDEAESDDDFAVSLNDSTYPGRELFFTIHTTSEEGYESVIPFTLMVDGWDDENSPTGPVGPGYWFFEDNDVGFGYDVIFEYTSLDDDGDNAGVSDGGNNMDDIETVELPFEFPYWDDTYDIISICSNGFFTFGEYELPLMRNRPLPGALTPTAAVCPYWDDLASGRVYTYHNEAEGWFGIEWNNWRYIQGDHGMPTGDAMNFQVRLLDPLVHGAPGGLGIIVMMYDEIDNEDSDDNYCTIGITSPDGSEGLQYEFALENPPTVTGVHDGLQILIAVGSGGGIDLPEIEFSPPFIQISSDVDEDIAATFTLSNVGGLRMSYRLWTEAIWHSWQLGSGEEIDMVGAGNFGQNNFPDAGSNLLQLPGMNNSNNKLITIENPGFGSGDELDNFGGPDSLGYMYYDSYESYGPVFNWVAIEDDSNEVEWAERTDPRVTEALALPFTFTFYGLNYDSVWVTECGYLVFEDPNGFAVNRNTPLPRTDSPRAGIFPFWEEIGIDEGGTVYAHAFEDSFVVTWSGLRHIAWPDNDGPYTFQVLITADGAIHLQYGEMNPSFRSCTVGIQNENGDVALEVVRYQDAIAYLQSDFAVRMFPTPKWFTLDRHSGRLVPQDEVTIRLQGNTEGLEPGLYFSRVILFDETSNEADMIPVTLGVFDGDPGVAPQVVQLPGESVARGTEFLPLSLDPYVFDPDNMDREVSWYVYSDDGIRVTIDGNSIAYPVADSSWDGESTITFRAYDPYVNWVEVEVSYDTTDVNDPPRLVSALPETHLLLDDSLRQDTTLTFSIETVDPENDPVSISWFHRNEEIAVDTSSVSVILDSTDTDSIWAVISDGEYELEYKWFVNIYYYNTVNNSNQALPDKFALENVYPNPFNSTITATYALPQVADVRFQIFDILGREVIKQTYHQVSAGRHRTMIKGDYWSSGIYFLQWEAGGVKQVRKIMLIK